MKSSGTFSAAAYVRHTRLLRDPCVVCKKEYDGVVLCTPFLIPHRKPSWIGYSNTTETLPY